MLCLDGLSPVLFPQKAALGNDDRYLVLEPLRFRGQRGGGGVTEKGKDGCSVRRGDLDALFAQAFDFDALEALVFFLELLLVHLEDVAHAGHIVVASKDLGREIDGAAQRNRLAGPDAVEVVCLQPVALLGRRCSRLAVVLVELVLVIRSCDVTGCLEATGTEHGLGNEEVIESLGCLDRTKDVGRVAALDKSGSEKRVVAVPVGDEDVLWSRLVYAQTGVKQQVQLWDHERRVPCCAGPACEDVLLVSPGKLPFEDIRMS